MGLDFTAIDFETANSERASVCAVGAVKVVDGTIVDRFRTLVRPPEGVDEFDPINVSIHGITSRDVADAPTWPAVFIDLARFIGRDVIVAHNAAFDMSVLLNACSVCDIDWPAFESLCTMRLARQLLTVPSYSLPWVGQELGLVARDHHDPEQDALLAAEILLEFARRLSVESLDELSARTGVDSRRTLVDDAEPIIVTIESSPDQVGESLVGEVVCFTGALRSMVRDTARQLVVESGGAWATGVTKKTTVLVTGDLDARTFRPGAVFSAKLEKALELSESGLNIEILTEDQFVTRLSLQQETLSQRLASLGGRKSKAPDYVVQQARYFSDETEFWTWFRKSLASPLGRAVGGEDCIWCGQAIRKNAHWIYRDRRVCSGGCNEKLKRSAKRGWVAAGVQVPDFPL